MLGVNKRKHKSVNYQSFPSAVRPVAHSYDIPFPDLKGLPDLLIDEHSNEEPCDHKERIDSDDFSLS